LQFPGDIATNKISSHKRLNWLNFPVATDYFLRDRLKFRMEMKLILDILSRSLTQNVEM